MAIFIKLNTSYRYVELVDIVTTNFKGQRSIYIVGFSPVASLYNSVFARKVSLMLCSLLLYVHNAACRGPNRQVCFKYSFRRVYFVCYHLSSVVRFSVIIILFQKPLFKNKMYGNQ